MKKMNVLTKTWRYGVTILAALAFSIGQMWAAVDTWTVAASSAEIVNGTDTWSQNAAVNHMTNVLWNYWALEITDKTLTAGTKQFKICKDDSWDTSYPSENYNFTTPAGSGYTILYTFNSSSHDIHAYAFKSWTVAGDEAALGSNWNTSDANNKMTKSNAYTYTLSKQNVALASGTTYKCKAAKDNAWGEAYPGSDKEFTVASSGNYDITFTLNLATQTVDVATALVTYDITLDKNGGSADGSAKVTSGSATLSNVSAPTRANYHVEGYYTNEACTTKVATAAGALQASTTYTDANGKWIGTEATTLYTQWEGDSWAITYKDKGDVAYSGSNSALLPATYTYGTGIASLTDGVKAGYTFDGWFDNADCTGEAITSISASATGAITLYAKFTELVGGSVTLTAGEGGEVSKDNEHWGASATIADITAAQVVNIYARPNAGYTFNTWTQTAGTGSIKTNAAEGEYNAVAYSAEAIAASFTETKETLTPTVSYDHGSSDYTATSANAVGIATTTVLTASAPNETHYAFAGWTLTNLTVTDGNAATDRSITVKVTTPGSPIAAVANYNEVLTTPYVLNGGAAFGASAWAQALPLVKKSGHSTESVGYLTIENLVAVGESANTDYNFKIVQGGSTWYGLTGNTDWWYNRTSGEQTLVAGNSGQNIQLRADVAGEYEIKVDYTTPASPKITVTFPAETKYTVAVAKEGNGTVSPASVEAGVSTASAKITATANDGYYFAGWTLPESGVTIASGSASENEITINATAADKTITAKFAPKWSIAGSWKLGDIAAWNDSAYFFGNFGKAGQKDTAYIDLNLAADTKYEFIILARSASSKSWFKNEDETHYINYAENNNQYWDFSTGKSANCGLQTTIAGSYRFVWNATDNKLKVIFPTSYKVTFGHGVGGSSVTATVDAAAIESGAYVPAGKNIAFAQVPANGYTFKGWYTTADGNTPVALEENVLKNIAANAAVYAQYTPGVYTVTLNPNGGEIAEGKNVTSYTFGVGAALPTAEQITRAGHTFLGWYDNEGTSGTPVTAITTSDYGNKEFWAKWDKEPTLALTGSKETGINVGEAITLTATAENCTPSKFAFYEGETLLHEYTTTNLSQTHSYTPATVGDKTIKVVVTHASGTIQTTKTFELSTPSVSLAVKAGSASGIYLGKETTILVATPSNVGAGVTPSYVFTDQAETPVASESQAAAEWTYTPGVAGEKTMKVTMTVAGVEYTATTTVNVYEKWNIYVHDVNDWGKMNLFMWVGETPAATWPGTACEKMEENSTWYTVTLDSKYANGFILSKEGTPQTVDLAMNKATYAPNTYWYLGKENQAEKYSMYPLELADPTVKLEYDSVVNTNQLFLVGAVTNAGNDGTYAKDMKEVGFYIGETKYVADSVNDIYFFRYITGLTAGTKYAVKAYATNIHGTGESAAKDITTRAAGTHIIKVQVGSTAAAPKIYAWAGDAHCSGVVVENAAWPGVSMGEPVITGSKHKWYAYELSNEFNQFVICQGETAEAADATQTVDIANAFEDQCFWYWAEGETDADRSAEMACPYLTPQLMIGHVPGNTDEMDYLEMSIDGESISKTVTLVADTVYKFKPVYNAEWYGKSETTILTRAAASATQLLADDGGDLWVRTDIAGDYTFVFNTADKSVTVTYPQKTPTAIDETEAELKAVKFLHNGQMFIRVNGVVFDANGRRVE